MNHLLLSTGAAVFCGIVTYSLAKLIVFSGGLITRKDLPDTRRLHVNPTPRGGAVGLLLFVPAAALLIEPRNTRDIFWWLFGLALPNGFIGVIDDWRALAPEAKLGLQFLIAGAYVSAGFAITVIEVPVFGVLKLGWIAPMLTAVWLVWFTNVFNFMDGMDALAAGSGIIFMIALAVLDLTAQRPHVAVAATCIIAAGGLFGFLILNRPTARVFMGDGGALFVGALLAGATVLLSGPTTGLPPAAPFLVTGAFVFDAGYTLIRRVRAGERILEAHCSHLYQRLAKAGWSQTRVCLFYFGLNSIADCGALMLVFVDSKFHSLVWACVISAFAGLVTITRRVEQR